MLHPKTCNVLRLLHLQARAPSATSSSSRMSSPSAPATASTTRCAGSAPAPLFICRMPPPPLLRTLLPLLLDKASTPDGAGMHAAPAAAA